LEANIISNGHRKNKIHSITPGSAHSFSANSMTNNLKTLQISTTQAFANYKSRVAEVFFEKSHPKQRIRIRFSILTFLPVIIGLLLGFFLLLIAYFNIYDTLFGNGLFGELASNSIPNIEKIRKMRVIQFSLECIFFSGLLFIIDELFINDQIRKGRINSVYLLNGGFGIGIIFYSIANVALELRGSDPFILILSAKIIFMAIGFIYLIKSSFIKETFYLESKTPSTPPNNIEILQQVNYIRSFFMLCILFLLIDDLRIMQFYFHYNQFVENIPYILRDLTYIIASTILTNYLLLIGIIIEMILFFIVTAKIFDEKISQINKSLLIVLNILFIFYFGYGLFLFPIVFFLFYPEKLKILMPHSQRAGDQKKGKTSKQTTPSPKLNEREREIPAADTLNAERPIEIQQIVSDLENPLTTIDLEPVSEITIENNSESLDHQNSQKESILGPSIEESIEELNIKIEPPDFDIQDEIFTTPDDKMDFKKEEDIPPNHEKPSIILTNLVIKIHISFQPLYWWQFLEIHAFKLRKIPFKRKVIMNSSWIG
jgi:hypothetical protein